MQQNQSLQREPLSVDAKETKDPMTSRGSGLLPGRQAGEAEADANIATGRVSDLTPEDIQARIRALDAHTRP